MANSHPQLWSLPGESLAGIFVFLAQRDPLGKLCRHFVALDLHPDLALTCSLATDLISIYTFL